MSGTEGYVARVHLRLEPGAGIAKCGLGGRNPRLTDDPAEATCAACSQGRQARRPAAGRSSSLAARWNLLREEIRTERAAQDELAADHSELGHDEQTERCYGRVEALDQIAAMMDGMEAGQ